MCYHRRDLWLALEVDDAPCTLEPDLCFGGAATQDGQIRESGVTKRRLAKNLHRRDEGTRCDAVARGEQCVDRQRDPFVTQDRVGSQSSCVAEEFGRLRPCAVGTEGFGHRGDVICQCRVCGGRRGDSMTKLLCGIGRQFRSATVHVGDAAQPHQLDHRGTGHGICGSRACGGGRECERCDEESTVECVVDRRERIGAVGQLQCGTHRFRIVEDADGLDETPCVVVLFCENPRDIVSDFPRCGEGDIGLSPCGTG